MTSAIYCLSLIIFFEGSVTSEQTQRFIASTAIERAKKENLSICESMKKPKSYSWMWDGKKQNLDKVFLEKKIMPLAKQELSRPSMKGRTYFNECKNAKTGRKYDTKASLVKSDNLCFY